MARSQLQHATIAAAASLQRCNAAASYGCTRASTSRNHGIASGATVANTRRNANATAGAALGRPRRNHHRSGRPISRRAR
jgi:hypothetical protein